MKWEHHKKWILNDGEDFRIIVERKPGHPGLVVDGPYEWSVSVLIYPDHWRFPTINDDVNGYRSGLRGGPFRGGNPLVSTYFTHLGAVSCFEIEVGYSHLGDPKFAYMATRKDAAIIFRDAKKLFRWMAEPAPSVPDKSDAKPRVDAAFTPGPWRIVSNRGPGTTEIFSTKGALVEFWQRGPEGRARTMANAHLMSSSPEMLAMLKEVLEADMAALAKQKETSPNLDELPGIDGEQRLGRLRELIAQAEGRS